MAEISQKKSFAEGFGDVLRSSAIFYVRQSAEISTTISFMNYWKAKRGIDVAVIATTRTMDGSLIGRNRLRFSEGEVINFLPVLDGVDEGSVEIEIISTENLVFPYPALMALYETPTSISMVHSYARVYSRHEMEENKTVTRGEESNWTLRDGDAVRSFGVFHNGASIQPAQQLHLTVRSLDGRRRDVDINIAALAPYESFKLVPADHIHDLSAFLEGSPGQATLSFQLRESFTRMMVGNERIDRSDFQVTHSDFNFNRHKTDSVGQSDLAGFLRVPELRGLERWVVVYPEQDPGKYCVTDGRNEHDFNSGEPLQIPVENGHAIFVFNRIDGALPTRINTGIGCMASPDRLPSEPSLGVMHGEVPAKRMTWGPCAVSDELDTDIVVHSYDDVFGSPPIDTELCFRLYSASRHGYIEQKMTCAALDALDAGVGLEDVFPDAREYLDGQAGYFTLYSEYGGLKAYVVMKKPSGSATLEHCF